MSPRAYKACFPTKPCPLDPAFDMLLPLSVALTYVCLVSATASQEKIVAKLFVTDQPAFPGPLATVAGQPFVNNFILTDYQTNAIIATELGFCVPVRTPGPAQCQYTLEFAQGTLQAFFFIHYSSAEGANGSV